MDAITIPEFGGPDVLTWTTVPDPVPAAGEVLVAVTASAVNRADLMQREGHYPPPPGASAYPGLECAGRIAALGDGVTGWQVGDEVCALLAGSSAGYGLPVGAVAVTFDEPLEWIGPIDRVHTQRGPRHGRSW